MSHQKETQPYCPKCNCVLMYQDEDADGPCDQFVCMGDDGENRGCLDYYTREEAEILRR